MTSSSYASLIFKYNQLLFLIEQAKNQNVVLLTGNQTINGIKTFIDLPESSQEPTLANQLVNKTYVDSLVPTPVNAVLIDGDQTLGTGVKTFTNLPQSSTIPLSPLDLVNKAYVDGVGGTLTFPRQEYNSNSTFFTPTLPIGRYNISIDFRLDFPSPNKFMNINLVLANADGNLVYHPPAQYAYGFAYTLSGIVSINTSRPLIAVIELNSPVLYRATIIITYQSV
jgi:hypothetical protein